MKADVVDAFLKQFQLKPDEIAALEECGGGSVYKNFFSSLARVKKIHLDCRVLLRSNQQKAGLEIMESMALYQEAAYERLYRWTQRICHCLTADAPDVVPALCQAMKAFRERPVLLKCSLDELAAARRTAVVRMFLDALTGGGICITMGHCTSSAHVTYALSPETYFTDSFIIIFELKSHLCSIYLLSHFSKSFCRSYN
jgi:hypothetical protein